MRATRKLFLASALALTALAMAASSASAVTITQEPGGACPSNPSVNQHVVTGGCHVGFQDLDGIPLLAHTGTTELPISNCTVTLEARLATNGAGFATEQVFNDVTPGSCTRRPCDEAAGAMGKLAWPVAISAAGTSLEATFCLRTATSGEGGAPTNCPIHLPILTTATHRYQVGAGGLVEYGCEGLPQVEITDVELSSTGEQIEIS